MKPRRDGFTLIELLVVIAIIAILAAILFPVFARVRAKAEQNTCLSNVKQITLAAMMYASDYDGHFPTQQWGTNHNWPNPHWTTGYFDGNWNCPSPNWISGCLPYIKNTQIFSCPTAPFIQDPGTPAGANGSSYSYVGWVAGQDRAVTFAGGSYIGWGRKQTEMNAPAEIIMLHDAIDKGQVQGYRARIYPCRNGTGWYGADPTCDACVPPVHNGGFNSGFCDGHAKWLSQQDRLNKKWYE